MHVGTYATLHVIPEIDNFAVRIHVLLHRAAQALADQVGRVVAQNVATNAGRHLQDEDQHHQHGERQHHAVVLADRATTSEEGDQEDDDADGDQKGGHREELARQEVAVAMEHTLYGGSHRNEDDTCYLRDRDARRKN